MFKKLRTLGLTAEITPFKSILFNLPLSNSTREYIFTVPVSKVLIVNSASLDIITATDVDVSY